MTALSQGRAPLRFMEMRRRSDHHEIGRVTVKQTVNVRVDWNTQHFELLQAAASLRLGIDPRHQTRRTIVFVEKRPQVVFTKPADPKQRNRQLPRCLADFIYTCIYHYQMELMQAYSIMVVQSCKF